MRPRHNDLRYHEPARDNSRMPAATFPSIRSVHAGFAGWVLVAILLHAILLLIPSQRGLQPGQVLQRLTISLQSTAREESVVPTTSPAETPLAPELPPAEASGAVAEPAPARPVPPLASQPPTDDPPSPSAAQLLDLASRLSWQAHHTADSRDLGVFRPPPLPDNWQPGIPREANLFDGMTAPAEVEIVDRWLAADGSHNVVVNTPSGETYCGRTEAWSPLNPLFEPIMTWRPCGGGGRRDFEVPKRYHKASRRVEPR
jgi:hypothetical protein